MVAIRHPLAGAAVLGCALLLSACADSTDLKTPIDSFATAAKAGQTNFQTYETVINHHNADTASAAALEDANKVLQAPGGCMPGAKHCRLQVKLAENGGTLPLTGDPGLDVSRTIMNGVVTYATNMQTIVAIDSKAGADTAATAAVTGLGQLASDIDAATKSSANPTNLAALFANYQAPTDDAISFVLTRWTEAYKIAALRQATQRMDRIFPTLMTVCKETVAAGYDLQQKTLAKAFIEAETAFSTGARTPAKLDAYMKAASAYDTSLGADPRAPFDTLAEAQAALSQALNDPKPDFAQAMAALQRAIAAANQLLAIAEAFKTAAEKPQ